MKYEEPPVILDESLMKDYGHGVKAPDPVKVRVQMQKNAQQGKWVVDGTETAIRIIPEVVLVVIMVIVLATMPMCTTSRKSSKSKRKKARTTNKKSTHKDDYYDDEF